MSNLTKLKQLLVAIWSIFAGMYGGQKNKSVRRIGIPGFATLSALTDGFDWKDLSFLLLIPLLSMGYGVDSFLTQIFGSDSLVRLVYALLLSLPFYFHGIKRGAVASVSLAVAFQIRAGSLGSVGGFDILIEDIARYSVLGLLIAFNMFKKD